MGEGNVGGGGGGGGHGFLYPPVFNNQNYLVSYLLRIYAMLYIV